MTEQHLRDPTLERQSDPGADAFEHALEEMVMRVDEARIDHAAARVDRLLARLRRYHTDLGDASVPDPDVARRAFGGTRAAGQDADRITHDDIGRIQRATAAPSRRAKAVRIASANAGAIRVIPIGTPLA